MDKLAMTKTRQALDKIDYIELMSEHWRLTRVRFGSMCSYFFYAETQVIEFEKEHKKPFDASDFAKHHSCAIAAYGHMRSCFYFLRDVSALNQINIEASQTWMQEVIDKRDRLQGHPNEKNGVNTIMVHDRVILKGGIQFPLWNQNLKKAEGRINITVYPRKDLNILAEMLESVSDKLLTSYLKEKELKPHLLTR